MFKNDIKLKYRLYVIHYDLLNLKNILCNIFFINKEIPTPDSPRKNPHWGSEGSGCGPGFGDWGGIALLTPK